TVRDARFGKWRYPLGFGARFPDLWFDGLAYVDVLLRDLGLGVRRKGGWVQECFRPYGPGDYAGLVDEWRGVQRRGVEAMVDDPEGEAGVEEMDAALLRRRGGGRGEERVVKDRGVKVVTGGEKGRVDSLMGSPVE
ncbi:hypothetical protein LTS18_000393, partial [Coniosporium uncinatum]